jgi:3-methyl-2-oxobutanoate hydroxymethyltransferase
MENSKVTVPGILARKSQQKLVMVTAYDYSQALLADGAGMDIVLVGDSLGNVVLGYPHTLPVTMEDMLHHTRAVRRGVARALLVADMPYLSCHFTPVEAARNAGRLVQEGGAEAVKVEGGARRLEAIQAILDAEIPVMGHLGLTPQSIHAFGGYRVQGRGPGESERLVEEARALEKAGVFALVLECVPAAAAEAVTRAAGIPTIGIGAGPSCDGQVLVFHDLLGLTPGPRPRFVRSYLDLRAEIGGALARFKEDVEAGRFPSSEESF